VAALEVEGEPPGENGVRSLYVFEVHTLKHKYNHLVYSEVERIVTHGHYLPPCTRITTNPASLLPKELQRRVHAAPLHRLERDKGVGIEPLL
jgi:hypothetical protein